MAIEVILFDLGKVLFDFDLNKLASDFAASSSTKNYAQISNMLANHWEFIAEYEKGQISSENFYRTMAKTLDLKMSCIEFSQSWNNIFTPCPEVIEFAKCLSSKYNLGILSNTNDLHFEFLKNKYPQVFESFKNHHLSYKMNARKPEKEIYQKVINFYNIPAEKIFFTDDLDKNIKPAKELKISAFTFDSLSGLKQNLNLSGVAF